MKNLLVVFLLMSAGFSYGKELPAPFWYNLSKKILVETQRLVTLNQELEALDKPKTTTKTVKIVKAQLK